MNILSAILDPRLLRSAFGGTLGTWLRWFVYVCALLGIPFADLSRACSREGISLTEGEALSIFQQHTGRQAPRPGGYRQTLVIVAPQSGKTSILAVLAVYSALTGRAGQTVAIIAQSHRASKAAPFRYVKTLFEDVPALRAEVVSMTAETIELKNGVRIVALPSDAKAARGLMCAFFAVDEAAFVTDSEGSPNAGELWSVGVTRTLMTGGISGFFTSPDSDMGSVPDLFKASFGNEDSPVLAWQSDSRTMNPVIDVESLEALRKADPARAVSEVDGLFRTSSAIAAFDAERLAPCVDPEVTDRTASSPGPFFAFVDMSSGSGKDSAAVAVAHVEYDETVVLDAFRVQTPPFDPEKTVATWSAWLRSLGVSSVTGDRFSPGLLPQSFARYGITYEPSTMTRSELFLALVPLVNATRVRLLDDAVLLAQLKGLQRRASGAGRDSIDHAPGRHDDIANACAGAVIMASKAEGRVGGGWRWNAAGWCQIKNGQPVNGIVCPEKSVTGAWTSDMAAIYSRGRIVRLVPFIPKPAPPGVLRAPGAIWG